MKTTLHYVQDHLSLLRFLGKWFLLILPVALLSGTTSAFFLWALDEVTQLRWQHGWLLYGLPLIGVLILWLYQKGGKNAERGNNLLIDEIHQPGGGVPGRMAPLVLLTSLLTHLFGGSAGREGTAVQMGGSIAGVLGRQLRLSEADLRILLMSGIAAGFGAIFGTPLAGAVFALEVLTIGKLRYQALIPCLMASILGDITCAAWGIHHIHYQVAFSHTAIPTFSVPNGWLLTKVALAGALFGLAALVFSELTHGLQRLYKTYLPSTYLRPIIGGVLLIGLVWLVGTRDYLGLGVVSQQPNGISILNAFHSGGITPWSWFWKLLFTAITLSSGFKGGEVTPLFFIGACLGNLLAGWFNAPVDLFAALGFIAIFAGASNTPLASTLMGLELFGSDNLIFFAIACFVAYFFSGHTSIYSAQRLGVTKSTGRDIVHQAPLSRIQTLRRRAFTGNRID
ncbi:H+/Cl- antiporter ClcA [Spirosoma oryzae]|uniref:Cl-channel voltage-gated family protein n=2 Tax=Spirosoma TaxID=107 RepID=D2QVT2_SPILD|nr:MULTISPECIES: voltage-gated chloride channel family protein [Spirosoma]ADB42914.1 Cl- channel voltage-gated family protein [Spirosoma linguale DSM 74]MBR8837143.1 voltage-gated chloride channel family protein [Stigonema ocellatum SAG 48.90 = DSM 106950]MCX6213842.1 voltage-gated chloride channel family protein [Spirosoma sp.]PRY34946.1 H+/Cl- antiporter ClcA [Spirosoma oryzae]